MAPCIRPDRFEQNVSTVYVDQVPGSYVGDFLVNLPSPPPKVFYLSGPILCEMSRDLSNCLRGLYRNVERVNVDACRVHFLTAVRPDRDSVRNMVRSSEVTGDKILTGLTLF